MRKLILLSSIFLMLFATYSKAQNIKSLDFDFPKNRMGQFAEDWFKFMNTGVKNEIRAYDKEDEWADFLSTLSNFSQRVNGITPISISYETNEYISIYSKENEGGWVKVNLGLNATNQITEMGIKKSVMPVAYNLSTNLNKLQVQEIIKGISNELRHNYVVKKLRLTYSDALIELMNSEKYDTIMQGDLLAEVLTKDLVEIANDKHLQVIAPSVIKEVEARFGLADQQDEGSDESHSRASSYKALAGEQTVSYQLLDDNIVLISLARFVDDEKTIIETRNAFSSLESCKGIIIDLRYSGGGDGLAMVNLMSYFVGKEELIATFPSLIETSEINETSDQDELSSKYISKPLYVLTSSKTISAGEAFVYYLKKKNRATIVGEVTAGAGYRVDVSELPNKFYFVNSIFTSFDTKVGEDWQGKGIKPNIATRSKDALNKALSIINNKM